MTAQTVTGFKLSDYKFRTPLFRGRVMEAGFNQGTQVKSATTNSAVTSINLDGSLLGFSAISTDKMQDQRTFNIKPAFSTQLGNNKPVKNAYLSLANGASLSLSHRVYGAKYYTEYGYLLGISQDLNRQKTGTALDQTGNLYGYASGYYEMGKGRMENVDDAATALYLLEDLYKGGIITSKVNAGLANELAKVITRIKHTRTLDTRRWLRSQITAVDSFLHASKIVDHWDPRTGAIINDNLFFNFSGTVQSFSTIEYPYYYEGIQTIANLGYIGDDVSYTVALEPFGQDKSFIRRNGELFYARLRPAIDYRSGATRKKDNIQDVKTEDKLRTFFPTLFLGYKKEQALSLYWQKLYGAGFSAAYDMTNGPLKNFMVYNANVYYGKGYYPNSRTVVEGSLSLNVFDVPKQKEWLISPGADVSFVYFLGFQTYLTGGVGLNYTKMSYTGSDFNESIRFRIVHRFF